ncbi:MAG: chorismate--pyruvate lyase family protein [Pseudomonadota bacterium]
MKMTAHQRLRADSELGWMPQGRGLLKPDPVLRSWLLDRGSLTRRLQRLSSGRFEVRVQEEGWQRCHSPTLTSCLSPRRQSRMMWSRQVVLTGNDQPWVVAHTLIPVDSLRGDLRRLTVLRDMPLGAILFRQRQIRRGVMEVARSSDGIWGRRSLFFLQNRPLLVAEFFLPALRQRIRDRQSTQRMDEGA